jgi:tripeptidyl-peptidase-2
MSFPPRHIAFASVALATLLLAAVSSHDAADKPAASADNAVKPFPVEGLLPKAEIGALRFLEKQPESDGRGVVVAIFDTGVDPGAPGLQTTTDGQPKIIDIIDGTGSGDVDTSTIVETSDGTLEGLTGRKLTTGKSWKNPKGKFRLGLKRAYDFFPGSLVGRMKQKRRKDFDREQRRLETELRREMVEWDAAHPKPTPEERRLRADLKTRLDQLKAAGQGWQDPGPLFDCVVFHDGSSWRAVVDTDEDGDLAEEKLLTNFRDEREFGTFDDETLLHFGVNIHDEGDVLSIVVPSGAHGTHVAGIVSAHFADHPESNGAAPGTQIVSVKIGDARLGSMETGAGLIRGLSAVLRNKCDLINMSYGEATSTPNRGRLIRLFSEVVDKHGVIFVASAGNSGPALSTVGAPGGTSTSVIGVGAYISPAMMAAEYTLRKILPEMPYTWSSRGPTFDGDMGVDIFAPGGAIAPVPAWTLNRSMQMNGTSMASPNACGAVALLVSGMKAAKKQYSPYSVRRAIQNTARFIENADTFAQGPGLIQVDKAFSHLVAHADATAEQLRFDVTISSRGNARGLYLREPAETQRASETTVRVRPVFPEDSKSRSKADFEMRIALEATQQWIETGGHLVLTSGGRTFSLRVDSGELDPGVHVGEVLGYDDAHRERGPLFRVPVTVVRPVEPSETDSARDVAWSESVEFEPGDVVRRFLAVPAGATWADLVLKLEDDTGARRRFIFHTVQATPGRSFEAAEAKQYVSLDSQHRTIRSFPVEPGRMLELCLSQYWSSLGASTVACEVTFHGLVPSDREITIAPGSRTTRVNVASPLHAERLAPVAELKTWRQILRPTASVVRALSQQRDRLTNGRQVYELVLTYNFDQKSAGSVTPRFPANDDLLYDSRFGTQLLSIFDEANRRVVTDDIFPGAKRLGKGKHTVKLQLTHEDVSVLDSLKNSILCLDRPLSRAVSLSIYASEANALSGGTTFPARTLLGGETASLVIRAPSTSQWPAGAEAGDVLLGTIQYGRDDAAQEGAERRPSGFPLRCVVPRKSSATPKTKPPVLPANAFALKLEQLKRMATSNGGAKFDALVKELLVEKPNHLPVLVAQLHQLDNVKTRKEHLPEVVTAADTVLNQIDTAALERHFGTRINPEDSKATATRKRLEKQRDLLVDTLYRKGRALGYMELPDVVEKHPVADPKALDAAFEANFAALRRWVDTTETKYGLLHIRRERRHSRYGAAIKLLDRYIAASAPNYWYHKKRRDTYEKLGWKHLFESERRWLVIRFPKRQEGF